MLLLQILSKCLRPYNSWWPKTSRSCNSCSPDKEEHNLEEHSLEDLKELHALDIKELHTLLLPI